MDGRDAETLVGAFLKDRGYRILARNWRTPFGEIDLVALDGETLCFVEVRARGRGARVSAIESVDAAKRRRIERTAEAFVRAKRLEGRVMRFDFAGVSEESVDYVEGAW